MVLSRVNIVYLESGRGGLGRRIFIVFFLFGLRFLVFVTGCGGYGDGVGGIVRILSDVVIRSLVN